MHVRASRFLACAAVAAAATIAAQPLDRLTGKVVERRPARRFRTPTCASRRSSASPAATFSASGRSPHGPTPRASGRCSRSSPASGCSTRRRPASCRTRSRCRSTWWRRPAPESTASRRPGIRSCGCRRRPPATSAGSSPTPPRRRGRSVADRVTPLLSRLADSNDAERPGGGRQHLPADARCRRSRGRSFAARSSATRRRFAPRSGWAPRRSCSATSTRPRRRSPTARNLTKDKDERGYLSAAIAELNKAHNVMRGTY